MNHFVLAGWTFTVALCPMVGERQRDWDWCLPSGSLQTSWGTRIILPVANSYMLYIENLSDRAHSKGMYHKLWSWCPYLNPSLWWRSNTSLLFSDLLTRIGLMALRVVVWTCRLTRSQWLAYTLSVFDNIRCITHIYLISQVHLSLPPSLLSLFLPFLSHLSLTLISLWFQARALNLKGCSKHLGVEH